MIRNFTFRAFFVAMLSILLITSCEKDEIIEDLKEETVFPKIKGSRIKARDLFSDPIIGQKIEALSSLDVSKSATAGIQLDTSLIRLIETDRYKSYTFKIIQDRRENFIEKLHAYCG